MLKPHSFCRQPSVSLSSPQASIPPLDFPSEGSDLYSLPPSFNFHPLCWFPCPITLLVTEGSKHVQLVKRIPGPLSRLQLQFSVRKSSKTRSVCRISLSSAYSLCFKPALSYLPPHYNFSVASHWLHCTQKSPGELTKMHIPGLHPKQFMILILRKSKRLYF